MKLHGIGRLKQAARRIHQRFARKALILLYHRIARLDSDPWSLCVTPQHFTEHLEVLRKYYRPLQLCELVQSLREGKVKSQSLVVTFDDGYADNFHEAKPLLERHEVPATIFLTTDYIGREREFWWDELDKLFLEPRALPPTLAISINTRAHEWKLDDAAYYSNETRVRYRHWRAWEESPTSRHLLYASLYQLLMPLPEGERRKVLGELLSWASTDSTARSTHRLLSLDETIALSQGALIEIGAHTVTHPVLSTLTTSSQRAEIQESKRSLEEILGRKIISFAYPYGKREHYSEQSVALVREAGFVNACSNFAGIIERDSDPFQLPRVQVKDWDGDDFARRLSAWLEN